VAGLALAVAASSAAAQSPLADANSGGAAPADPWSAFRVAGGGRSLALAESGLHFVRSTGDNVAFDRSLDAATLADGLVFKFDVSLANLKSNSRAAQIFRIGSGFGTLPFDENNALTYARLAVNTNGESDGFQLRHIESATNSETFHGTQAVTWAINTSGHSLTYGAPDGSIASLEPNRMDVWVGRVPVFDEAAVTTASVVPNQLKWLWSAGTGTAVFDYFQVTTLKGTIPVASTPAGAPAATPATPGPETPTIELYRVSPNPFGTAMRFAYAVSHDGEPVEIAMYDVAGRQIRTLVAEAATAGRHETSWDGRDNHGGHAMQGVYFLRAAIGADRRVVRVVYLGP
jgi:hypothetical protein